jgi:allophanate hydrolase subunit 2
VHLAQGDVLQVAALAGTSCGYLAVEGGIGVPLILGSASTYTRGGLGGFEGRPLRIGDVLDGSEAALEPAERELAKSARCGFRRADPRCSRAAR